MNLKKIESSYSFNLIGGKNDIQHIKLDSRSWIKVIKKGFRLTQKELDIIWNMIPKKRKSYKIYGKDVPVPRFLQLYGDIQVTIKGQTFSGTPFKQISDQERKILKKIIKYAGKFNESNYSYNSVLVNWYPSGQDYIGYNSDSEKGINPAPIVSISFGGTRKFYFKRKSDKETVKKLDLESGDVVVMGGKTQDLYKHSVPKTKKAHPRINFTVRSYKT